jgi:hypothetical protein
MTESAQPQLQACKTMPSKTTSESLRLWMAMQAGKS